MVGESCVSDGVDGSLSDSEMNRSLSSIHSAPDVSGQSHFFSVFTSFGYSFGHTC